MDGLWDVMWKAALAGVVVGGTIGYFEKQKSEKAARIGNQFDSLWNDIFHITPVGAEPAPGNDR